MTIALLRELESNMDMASPERKTDGRTERLIKLLQAGGGELTYIGHLALIKPDGQIENGVPGTGFSEDSAASSD